MRNAIEIDPRHPWWTRPLRFLTTLASGAAAETEEATAEATDDDDDLTGGVFGAGDDDGEDAPPDDAGEEAEGTEEPAAEAPPATEEEAEEEVEDEPSEAAQLLEETWTTRLERMEAKGENARPKLDLDLASIKPTKAGTERFKRALEAAGTDEEAQMAAAFEAAMDAVIQVLPLYHNHIDPLIEGATATASDVKLGREIERFHATPEGEAMLADEPLRQRMEAKFDAYSKKYGWRRAIQVPMRDYYRMAGGKSTKAAKPAAAKSPPPDANDRKRAALGAANAPRGARTTTPAPRGKGQGASDVERESAEFIRRESRPLFTVE